MKSENLMEKPMPGTMFRVLLADDHRVMRQGLAALLSEEPDIEIVGQAADGQLAVDLCAQCEPDVVIMDVSMPVMNGIDATRIIKSRWPRVRIISLSMFDEFDLAQDMKNAGAEAYLSKVSASEDLVGLIRRSPEPA